MKMHVCILEVARRDPSGTRKLDIRGMGMATCIAYEPSSGRLTFDTDNELSRFLQRNETQFRKILHVKNANILSTGFRLKFAIWDQKDVRAFNNIQNLIALEKRGLNPESYIITKGKDNIPEIYTDGSFLVTHGRGGYVVLIKDIKGNYTLHTITTAQQNSSLIELMAAIKGMELLRYEPELRIITDSQYVRKGITEWIFYWKLNGWTTANGDTVKNIDYWKRFDQLTENKYIEFQWVKSHNGHFENTICDLYARETAYKPPKP